MHTWTQLVSFAALVDPDSCCGEKVEGPCEDPVSL